MIAHCWLCRRVHRARVRVAEERASWLAVLLVNVHFEDMPPYSSATVKVTSGAHACMQVRTRCAAVTVSGPRP